MQINDLQNIKQTSSSKQGEAMRRLFKLWSPKLNNHSRTTVSNTHSTRHARSSLLAHSRKTGFKIKLIGSEAAPGNFSCIYRRRAVTPPLTSLRTWCDVIRDAEEQGWGGSHVNLTIRKEWLFFSCRSLVFWSFGVLGIWLFVDNIYLMLLYFERGSICGINVTLKTVDFYLSSIYLLFDWFILRNSN